MNSNRLVIVALSVILLFSRAISAGAGATNVYITNKLDKTISYARQLTETEIAKKKAAEEQKKNEKDEASPKKGDELNFGEEITFADSFDLEEKVSDTMSEETKIEAGKDVQVLSMGRNLLGIGESVRTETLVLDIKGTKFFLYITTASWGFNASACTKDHRCVFLPAPNGSIVLLKDGYKITINTYIEWSIPNVRFVVEKE